MYNVLIHNDRGKTSGCVHTYLSDSDVFELGGEGEHSEELNLTEGGLHHLVVGGHRLVGQVVVGGNTTQLRHLQMRRGRGERERKRDKFS